ncbi:hypothetical protein [Barrientosiimonas endolithica]|uniref:DUF559 domain-containing protein n=1 Tax=Barrientosiimonas endolithica TaxID=1535208 RepID=A0ABN6YNG7_9MICO|nr:hypothetical protein [Barrientosiimonas endolithica]BDZ58509.1 hypothetical protein GCM10025872_21660 [Barrientosiimonas endolithica]
MEIDEETVAAQGDVASRAQLRGWGVTRWQLRNQVAARRWRLHGLHTVALHTGELSATARWWRACWESGSRAALDGVSALLCAGLTGFCAPAVTVSLPSGRSRPAVPGVRVHYVERRIPGELITAGAPRTRPEVAALRAACWADSDRQAALLLVMPAQQRLVSPARLAEACDQVALHWRPRLVRAVVADVASGAQALGELDFGLLCQRYDLPRPDRQVVRQGPNGRLYLDAGWEALRLFVEIDGIHHHLGLGPVDDALRQNELHLGGDTILRIPLLGLRTHEAELMGQVVRAYRLRVAAA